MQESQLPVLQRVSPLTSLARPGPSARTHGLLAPAAFAADDSNALNSPLSRAFEVSRASLLTTGSQDLGIDRSSGQYADVASLNESGDEAEGQAGRLSMQTHATRSSRSEGTDETSAGPFAFEVRTPCCQSAQTPVTAGFQQAYMTSGRASSQFSSGRGTTSDRFSRGSAPRQVDEQASTLRECVGDHDTALVTPKAISNMSDPPVLTPRPEVSTNRAMQPVRVPESGAQPPPPVNVSQKVTVPTPAGRVRSHTQSGTFRNFSRPSTLADVSPETSPSKPLASTSRLQLDSSTAPSSSSMPASSRPPLRDTSPQMMGKRPMLPHNELHMFPPDSSPPQMRAPPLSRGPSAASTVDPMTPASPHRGLPDTSQWDPWNPKGDHPPSRSLGYSETGSEDDQRSTRSSGRSPKWKFWSRKPSRSIERDQHSSATHVAPAVHIGLPDTSLDELEHEFGRVAHRRQLSDLKSFRGPQMHAQQSPPSPRLDRRPYAAPADLSAGDETEMLRDDGIGSRPLGQRERVPSQMSYYSYHSIQSNGSSQGEPGPQSPVQSSSHGHSTNETDVSSTMGGPPRAAGSSMQKARDLLRAPMPNGRPATEPRRRSGETQRQLSPNDPEDCLHLGIDCHERGELERSAMFFERAAKINGGCGMGKLLWGLTLRHGWGCAVDQVKGFSYLQKAAETVVDDLDAFVASSGTPEADKGHRAAKAELVLSIYELGMSFRKGWGVRKDKKMALGYFELASKLGDPDAQQELGFAYLYGKGCKKDKAKAAEYYRLAAGQGIQSFGQQWIWRRKYGGPGTP